MHLACGSPSFITHDEAATLTSVIGNRVMVDKKATVEYVYWAVIAEHACNSDDKCFCSKPLPEKTSPTRFAVAEEILLMEMSDADKMAYLPLRITAYKTRRKLEARSGRQQQPRVRDDDTVEDVTAFFRRALATGKMPNLKPQIVEKEVGNKPDRFDLVIGFLEEQLNQLRIKEITSAS
ncbi:hypothetical protein IKH83_00970 [Candidatus Saccharibacteria bacterium]|nr:hypothetical protein [Candidatus Saccharibacteria bacterium]